MPWLPYDYWASYEERVSDFAAYDERVRQIETFGQDYGRIYLDDETQRLRFFWRGQANLVYGLHSSLARLLDSRGKLTETNVARAEAEIIAEARTWLGGGHVPALPALDVLALLQHHGAPTRLLDFTRDPYMALFFAAEKDDANPGRVLAIGVPEGSVSFTDAEATSHQPAWRDGGIADWEKLPRVWEPTANFPRLRAQQGVFLVGGVPSNDTRRNMLDPASGSWRAMTAREVRHCMSVPFNLSKFERARAAAETGQRTAGQPPKPPIGFTLRIEGSKDDLRSYLAGHAPRIDHSTVYPDEAGFAAHAASVARAASA
jgi:hypothetical protein